MLNNDIIYLIGEEVKKIRQEERAIKNYNECIKDFQYNIDRVIIKHNTKYKDEFNEKYFLYNYFDTYYNDEEQFYNNMNDFYAHYEEQIEDFYFYCFLLEEVEYNIDEYKFGETLDILVNRQEELKNIIERHEEQEKEKERIKEINFDLELDL